MFTEADYRGQMASPYDAADVFAQRASRGELDKWSDQGVDPLLLVGMGRTVIMEPPGMPLRPMAEMSSMIGGDAPPGVAARHAASRIIEQLS